MSTLEEIRPFLETVYFVTAGPGLLVAALIALKQITVAKQTAKTISIREAYKLAAEQVDRYTSKIIPDQDALLNRSQELGITFLTKRRTIISGDSITLTNPLTDDELAKLSVISKDLISVLNAMDTFSLFFTSRVADESIAFHSVGKAYVDTIHRLYPAITIANDEGHFDSCIKLFRLWNNRIEAEKLTAMQSSIQDQLDNIDSRQIHPIGSE